MNTQNILKYYGTKLDIRLDSSEFYDYEISKVQDDYDVDVLDISQPITYTSLKIDGSLIDHSCGRSTISLSEIDYTAVNPNYIYSGLTAVVNYDAFVNHISNTFEHTILNSNVFQYTGLTNEIHYFQIAGYNQTTYIDPNFNIINEDDIINGFDNSTGSVLKCSSRYSQAAFCCPFPNTLNNKPWAYQFIDPVISTCDPLISRRTEKGWTLDFIFNRETLPWSSGGVFYYFGQRGSDEQSQYADNNLSFQFTPDRRIKWVAHHYSGYCQTGVGYDETYYIASGQTPQLCTTGDTKDFNITIVFDRYKRYSDCDLENSGGWNDQLGWVISDYSDIEITAVTSTQLATYESTYEFLNKKWADERNRRLGTLKIYLNGRPIYKLEDWEEVIPSNRGSQPFIQSWGGGTGLMGNIHNGVCCFNIKSIKYYEEPLDFVHVRHNFITRLNQYDFFICGEDCVDELIGYYSTGILSEDGEYILTEDNNVIIY